MPEMIQDPGQDPGEKETPGYITKVCAAVLELPPSCVGFSPKWPDYFVIGTYNLEKKDGCENEGGKSGGQDAEGNDSTQDKKPQSRNGTLILYRLLDDDV
jgi:diphthamide biosynthesis protein 7